MADGKAQDALPIEQLVPDIGQGDTQSQGYLDRDGLQVAADDHFSASLRRRSPLDHPQLRFGGQPSGENNPSQPQTYTPNQVEKLVNERHSKLDKTIAQLTKERDSFKASHDSLSAQFADLQRRIDEEEAAKYKDDPDQLDIYQRRKKLLAEQEALKAERDALAKEKQDNAERLAKAAEAEWEGTVLEIATAAKGDAAKLKAKASLYGITDPGKLRGLAADLWPTGITADSGQTSGGGTNVNKLSPREQIAYGLQKK